MAHRRIVILGGTLAGPTAAARAREVDEDADIIVVQRGSHLSFSFAGLHHHLSGEVPSLSGLDQQDAAFFRDYYGVTTLLRTEATAMDIVKRTLTVKNDDGILILPWDTFVFALGAESLSVAGLSGSNVWHLRTFADAKNIHDCVTQGGKSIAVIGGGSFGIEAVDGLIRAGARVTVIEQNAGLLPRFSSSVSGVLLEHLRARADVHLGVSVVGSECASVGGKITRLKLSNGTCVDVDGVVVCVGVKPRTALLKAAGVQLGDDGTVAVNLRAEVGGVEGLYACGASVAVPSVVTGNTMWWAQAAIADKVAQVGGENAAGGHAAFAPFTGSMLVRAIDLTVGRSGLSYQEAAAAFGAADVDRTLVPGQSHERWFPGSMPLLVEIFSRRTTGRLLGVEACGAVGIDKRIDVAAAALTGALTVEQLASLDLGFAGAFNASRDVLNTAGSIAAAERAGTACSITPTELHARSDWQLVDVRTIANVPGLPGAVALPLHALRARLGELDQQRPTVVFSTRGRRGWLAMRLLRQRGFLDVRNLAGGLMSLLGEQPTTTTTTTTTAAATATTTATTTATKNKA